MRSTTKISNEPVEGWVKMRPLILDARRRFPKTPELELVRYIVKRNDGAFTSFDQARSVVRSALGTKNDYTRDLRHRLESINKSLVLNRDPFILPPGRWGLLSDPHVPFHAEKAFYRALEWLKGKKVTGLLFTGDFQDCQAVSYWPSTRRPDFLKEVEMVIDMLDLLKLEFPKCKIVLMRGNHEDRLENYYRANAPHLCDLPSASMEHLLSLDERGIIMTERKQKVLANELTILHGHEMRGSYSCVSPARWAMLKAKTCCIVGHFHQESKQANNRLDGSVISTWSMGCLCDLHPDYNPWGNEWNHGVALLDLDKDSWEIDNRKILNNGKVV